MAKDPAFLFYSSDFLSGTLTMSFADKGQYITILCALHQNGRLTLDEMKIVCNNNPVSEKVLAKFKQDETGAYFNERLDEEINKRKRFTESRRNSLNINNDDQVHIYLLFNPVTGFYKIGSSKYPQLRLTEVQKKIPTAQLFWKSEILVNRSNEKKLHDEFQAKRKSYDWFSLTENDLNKIINNTELKPRTETRTENENRNGNSNSNEKDKRGVGKKGKAFVPPTLHEFTNYFLENEFDADLAKRAWTGYAENNWHDSHDNPIRNWKTKAQQIWFKKENKTNGNRNTSSATGSTNSTGSEKAGRATVDALDAFKNQRSMPGSV